MRRRPRRLVLPLVALGHRRAVTTGKGPEPACQPRVGRVGTAAVCRIRRADGQRRGSAPVATVRAQERRIPCCTYERAMQSVRKRQSRENPDSLVDFHTACDGARGRRRFAMISRDCNVTAERWEPNPKLCFRVVCQQAERHAVASRWRQASNAATAAPTVSLEGSASSRAGRKVLFRNGSNPAKHTGPCRFIGPLAKISD